MRADDSRRICAERARNTKTGPAMLKGSNRRNFVAAPNSHKNLFQFRIQSEAR